MITKNKFILIFLCIVMILSMSAYTPAIQPETQSGYPIQIGEYTIYRCGPYIPGDNDGWHPNDGSAPGGLQLVYVYIPPGGGYAYCVFKPAP